MIEQYLFSATVFFPRELNTAHAACRTCTLTRWLGLMNWPITGLEIGIGIPSEAR